MKLNAESSTIRTLVGSPRELSEKFFFSSSFEWAIIFPESFFSPGIFLNESIMLGIFSVELISLIVSFDSVP